MFVYAYPSCVVVVLGWMSRRATCEEVDERGMEEEESSQGLFGAVVVGAGGFWGGVGSIVFCVVVVVFSGVCVGWEGANAAWSTIDLSGWSRV